jgi:AraC-like DNA-binding protein
MKERRHTNPALPLVRLKLVEPLLQMLEQRGIDAGEPLERLSLKPADVGNPDVLVPAPRMYEIVETLADCSGDPHFGIHAGEALNPRAWSPLADVARMSATLGEFLLRFMESAEKDASSVTYSLTTQSGRSTFRERRFTDGGVFPRHNDGFTVAYLLSIIRRAVGPNWDGARVLARCCDPGAIPGGYHGIRTASTDTLGASIGFPASWLLRPIAIEQAQTTLVSPPLESPPSGDLAQDFRRLIRPYLHEFNLDVDRVAEICGLSKRTLARKLQQRGTSVQKEISDLRRTCAEYELRHSDKSIAAIAAEVGYSDPSVFSRAFKRWTGLPPRQFRQTRKRQAEGQR